jgi:L-2-hydroxyglutarate oxidase LhgO
LYWKASDAYAARIKRLIYPAPDIRMPFLGIHITRTVDGKVLFGPTAIPAFGRENYSLFGGLDLFETPKISWQLLAMLVRNPSNFRSYVREEMARYWPGNFFNEARGLVRDLKREDIGDFYKVGIRAQLMNVEKGALEMDFILERGADSLHVLNAISPAFTSALGFAPHLVDAALASQIQPLPHPASRAVHAMKDN